MKPHFIVLTLFLALLSFSDVRAQESDPTEGYIISLRSLYEAADANSNTVGFLRPGEYVRLEHVHSLVYRVYRDDNSDVAGYVVYPKLSETRPENGSSSSELTASNTRSIARSTGSIRKVSDQTAGTGSVTNYSTVVRAATYGSTRWVHQTSNIRAGTGTSTDVVAQLPRGTAVKIGTTIGNWVNVFRSTDDVRDSNRALGYVHINLLKASPPSDPVAVDSQATRSNNAPASSGTETPEITLENNSDSVSSTETPEITLGNNSGDSTTRSILQSLSTSDGAVTENDASHEGHNHDEAIVFVTKTGKKYHLETCRHLRKSRKQLTLKEAKEKNFEACKTCKPDKTLAEAAARQ